MDDSKLYIVTAFNRKEGWRTVTDAVPRSEAVKAVKRQWNLGFMARANPAPQEAAA